MEIKQFSRDKFTIITLKGRLDSFNSPILNDTFEKLFHEKKFHFILDLGSVEFINSTTLGLLIEVMKKNKENSGSLSLAHCSNKVLKILQITKLDKVFSIYNDLDSALNSK